MKQREWPSIAATTKIGLDWKRSWCRFKSSAEQCFVAAQGALVMTPSGKATVCRRPRHSSDKGFNPLPKKLSVSVASTVRVPVEMVAVTRTPGFNG